MGSHFFFSYYTDSADTSILKQIGVSFETYTSILKEIGVVTI